MDLTPKLPIGTRIRFIKDTDTGSPGNTRSPGETGIITKYEDYSSSAYYSVYVKDDNGRTTQHGDGLLIEFIEVIASPYVTKSRPRFALIQED